MRGCDGGVWGEMVGEVGVEVALGAVGEELADVGFGGSAWGWWRLDELEDESGVRRGEGEAVDVAVVGPEGGDVRVRGGLERGRENLGEAGGGHGWGCGCGGERCIVWLRGWKL